MTDDHLPAWPPDWVEDHDLAAEQVVAASADVELASALRADDRILMSVSWPGGRRYLLIDPVGAQPAQALRAGDLAEDPEIARAVDGLWSRALTLARQIMDGELEMPGPDASGDDEPPRRRRPWRRGQG